jgi:hypothetical protein
MGNRPKAFILILRTVDQWWLDKCAPRSEVMGTLAGVRQWNHLLSMPTTLIPPGGPQEPPLVLDELAHDHALVRINFIT